MSVSLEDVARIDFGVDVLQAGIEAVGDDGVGKGLESVQVVDNKAAEEGGAVFERRLVDYHFGALGLDALHHALDRGLAEVVAV